MTTNQQKECGHGGKERGRWQRGAGQHLAQRLQVRKEGAEPGGIHPAGRGDLDHDSDQGQGLSELSHAHRHGVDDAGKGRGRIEGCEKEEGEAPHLPA